MVSYRWVLPMAACLAVVQYQGAYAHAEGMIKTQHIEGIKPTEDKVVRGLIYQSVANSRNSERRATALETLLSMDRERLLGAIACQMLDRDYRGWAVMFVRMHLPDKRLAPYLAHVIQDSKGQTLMEAVRAAQSVDDPGLLAPIFEHALDSDYVETVYYPTLYGRQSVRKPLFGEAARAIYIITKGATGMKAVPDYENLQPIRQEKIAELRAWWAENKDKWPPEKPADDKPKEDAKPPDATQPAQPAESRPAVQPARNQRS